MTADDLALVDRFLDMLASEAGASRNTLSAYRSDLAAAAVIVPSLASASMDELGTLAPAWSDLAASTLARRSAALRRLYGFLQETSRSEALLQAPQLPCQVYLLFYNNYLVDFVAWGCHHPETPALALQLSC